MKCSGMSEVIKHTSKLWERRGEEVALPELVLPSAEVIAITSGRRELSRRAKAAFAAISMAAAATASSARVDGSGTAPPTCPAEWTCASAEDWICGAASIDEPPTVGSKMNVPPAPTTRLPPSGIAPPFCAIRVGLAPKLLKKKVRP